MLPIHLLAVLLAAVAAFIIGFLMHGPVAGKLWMRLSNIQPTGNEKMSDMFGQLVWNIIVNLITAYALAVVYLLASTSSYTAGPSISTGLLCGVLVWFGFLATSSSIEVIWMGRSYKLWLFEVVSSLIVMLAMGAIIAALS